MNELIVSEIQLIPVKPKNGLVSFASCVYNNQLYLGNIAVYTSPSSEDGYRLLYPLKILPNGKEIHCFHPINRETGENLKKEIVREYENLLSKMNM